MPKLVPKRPPRVEDSAGRADTSGASSLRRGSLLLAGSITAAGLAAAYKFLVPTAAAREPLTPVLRSIAREHNISFGEFRRKYLATSTPVIVSGYTDAPPLTRDDILRVCGDERLHDPCEPDFIPVKYHVPGSNSWGSLANVPRNDEHLANFAQLLAAQASRSFRMPGGERRELSGKELYLHDASIETFCPALLAKVPAPRYFPVDYQAQMGPTFETPCEGRAEHPSLFVGAGQSQSGLHRDSLGTRFWMAVHEGSKAFRLTDPSTTLHLKRARPTPCDERLLNTLASLRVTVSPQTTSELCGGYRFDLFAENGEASALAAALAAGATESEGPRVVWDGVVGAGDLIFIPELWGHQVRNLEASVAVSFNLIDDYSIRTHATLLLELRAALEVLQGGPEERPEQLQDTDNRVSLLGFDVDQLGFPAHSLARLPDDAPALSWSTFAERNRQAEPLGVEAYLARLQEWEAAGGMERAIPRLKQL